MLWLEFILNTFLIVADACEGANHSRRYVQVRTAPKHRSTYISNYQSSEHKSNQHDESDQMKFPCTLKNALLIIRDRSGPSLCYKKDWATFLHFIYFCYLLLVINYLITKLYVTTYFSTCREYLAENRLSFPSAPRWVRHSYLSKGLRQIPYTCGSSIAQKSKEPL